MCVKVSLCLSLGGGGQRIYMHPQSERFILNPLIESRVVVGDVNEMKSLSLIEPRRGGGGSRAGVCRSSCLNICHLALRGSWNTSSRTRTTWCLSPLFMEDNDAFLLFLNTLCGHQCLRHLRRIHQAPGQS